MNNSFTGSKVKKAVILAGGESSHLNLLTRDRPLCMFPLFNKPLIGYTINFLKNNGIREIIIAGNVNSTMKDCVDSLTRNNGTQVALHFIADDKPKGTAGVLRDLKDLIGKDEDLIVVNGNIFIEDLNLNGLMGFHKGKNSVVTVAIQKSKQYASERIQTTKEGAINAFHIIHSSRERRSLLKPGGIYVVNSIALRFISETGYFDIKEQLIPALIEASLPVYCYALKGYYRAIYNINDYYEIQSEGLLNGFVGTGMTEVAEGIWIGEGVSVSSEAYLLGPIIIGINCNIEKNVQIIGPAVIGDNCKIGRGALIRESIIWEDSVVGDDSWIRYSVIGEGLRINKGERFDSQVVVDSIKTGEVNLLPVKHNLKKVKETTVTGMVSFKYDIYHVTKRLMDISLSFFGLIMFLPLILLIVIAIILDSPGTVFFLQKRCGKGGKDFVMFKFRTMVKDAEGLQKDLAVKKDVDGPVFKITNDPRITRIGSILRKTSLDEIPQLINVLKGDMSLVGPRPLVIDEMRFSPSWRDIRLNIKPGVTGLWQVQGRSEAPFHDWIRYDIYYVKHQSLWLDIKILIRTIKVVLKKGGAY